MKSQFIQDVEAFAKEMALVEHMLTDEKIQSDVLEIMSEYDSE